MEPQPTGMKVKPEAKQVDFLLLLLLFLINILCKITLYLKSPESREDTWKRGNSL